MNKIAVVVLLVIGGLVMTEFYSNICVELFFS